MRAIAFCCLNIAIRQLRASPHLILRPTHSGGTQVGVSIYAIYMCTGHESDTFAASVR